LTFTVGQAGGPSTGLTVSANSSNPTLVPNGSIVLNGNGTNWTVIVTPATNQTGTASIALTVCGGGLCTTASFGLTVNPLAQAPTTPPTITLSSSDSSSGGYSAPATVNLLASVGANGHTISQVQFYNGSTLLGQVGAAPYGFSWSSVGAGTYSLTAVAVYDSGSTVTSSPLNVTVSGLPAPWQSADIGSTGLTGSATMSGSVYTVQGAGNIGGSSDSFHYLYQSLTGDGQIQAQINSVQSTGGAAYVGVMIRETLTGPSSFAAMGISPNGWIRWNRRNGTGNNYSSTKAGSGTAPNLWVRVVRSGNTFTGYKSTDGVNWVQVNSSNITMASNIYIGFVVASGNSSTLNTSTFSDASVVP
jgi:regulation of enolase protein 1 (concanavalin A-like superfamily)